MCSRLMVGLGETSVVFGVRANGEQSYRIILGPASQYKRVVTRHFMDLLRKTAL